MQNILSFPTRQVDYKKFIKISAALTVVMVAVFGYLYTQTVSPTATSVAPGRLGAPALSHHVYGGFGDDALNKPMSAAMGDGRIYVSDTNNHRIQVFTEDGTLLQMFGQRGMGEGEFLYPYGIVVGPEGNLYIADMYRRDIQVLTPDGEFVRIFAEETGGNTAINGPGGMYLDNNDRLFVANVNTGKVAVFDIATEELLQVVAVEGDVFAPNDVTVDEDGYIYVVDTGGQRVVVYSPDGSRPVRIINGSEGGRGQSTLVNPRGIGIRNGIIYVVSNMSHTIHAFDKEGNELFQFGGQGERTNEFMHPNGLTIDRRGRMLITDTIGARIAVYR
ncbi:6-bladed beta-propeller [Dethiobacter alkaliphilus]|uniref:6-bladed beta-propeller n=1 Tax=Dethiobacter alkaliphilus TaxID=427926 RepID=UPI002227425F|nr:6-bladed beta-propeller [Dethiobacter alkaliphilus]MCW3491324.1 6-bladed beta-propeller [Dethiobacter alkaliphilus]